MPKIQGSLFEFRFNFCLNGFPVILIYGLMKEFEVVTMNFDFQKGHLVVIEIGITGHYLPHKEKMA